MAVQPWDAMQAWLTREQFAGYLKGCAIKYLARCDRKGGLQDIRKAKHYLEKLIEVQAAAQQVCAMKLSQVMPEGPMCASGRCED